MESARLWREVASHANSAPGWRTVGANGVPTNLEQSSESFASVDSMKQQQFGRAKACKTCGWTSLIGTLRNAWRQWTQKGRVNVAFKCFQCFLKLRNHPKHSSNMGMPLYTLNILEPSWTHFQVVDISRTNNCFKPKPEASYNRIQQATCWNPQMTRHVIASGYASSWRTTGLRHLMDSYGFLWLIVVWNMNFIVHYFPCHIWLVIRNPLTNSIIFQDGFLTTKQMAFFRWVWLGESNWEFLWSRQWDHGQGKLESCAKKHFISTFPDAPNQLTSRQPCWTDDASWSFWWFSMTFFGLGTMKNPLTLPAFGWLLTSSYCNFPCLPESCQGCNIVGHCRPHRGPTESKKHN